jgi:cytochrome P450
MTSATQGEVYYDNIDPEIGRDPHPVFRRLRDEAPLYYNERYDFYALSRYDDVLTALVDNETFISGKGDTLELIRSGMRIPPGTVLFEDPPAHRIHRALLSRMFTPKQIKRIEPEVRRFCADILDPLGDASEIDFVADLGMPIPMRVIGMLLGIPWDQQEGIRDQFGDGGTTAEEEAAYDSIFSFDVFNDYVDWRAANPSDDVVTELINVEFEDESGVVRRLTREELLMYLNVLAVAGNETTARLIGFTGQMLGDFADARREVAADQDLLPGAIDEILRYQPPALQCCRYVARDVELHGEVVPAGSAMLILLGSANRDDRHFERPDEFDIHRKGNNFSFGFGPHYCLGANLARLEARVAFEEVLRRFPDWEIDRARAEFQVSSTLRSWKTLPAVIG